MGDNAKPVVRMVTIGNGAAGKTSMLMSYATGEFEEETPTVFDTETVDLKLDGMPVGMDLFDTAGSKDYDRLRPLAYPHADVIVICYDVTTPCSLHSVKERWVPEARRYRPEIPIIMSGNKVDLRAHSQQDVSYADAQALCQEVGAEMVLECSAKTKVGLKDVFDNVARVGLQYKHGYTKASPRDKTCRLCRKPSKKTCECERKRARVRDGRKG